MTYDQLNHYAYDLVGKMKRSLKKKNKAVFVLEDLDIAHLRWRFDEALSTLIVYQLHELLVFIEKVKYQFLLKNQRIPTYKDMREEFRQELHIVMESV